MPDEDDRLDNDACGDLDDVFVQQHYTNNCEPGLAKTIDDEHGPTVAAPADSARFEAEGECGKCVQLSGHVC